MLTYKTYVKINQLASEYLKDKYDYCGAFCNNTILDSLLCGKISKQDVYKQHLIYVYEELKYYRKLPLTCNENKWFQELLIKYNFEVIND
jgi:hypothetical protein